jgi:hypothetical protein
MAILAALTLIAYAAHTLAPRRETIDAPAMA